MIITVSGCAIASFIICFFLAADMSMGSMLSESKDSPNLIMTQKDKF